MRQQQARITVTLDGVSLGVFEDRTGGDTDSTETVYQLGGMGPRISLGGSVQVGNVVVRGLFDVEMQARSKWLMGRAGRGRLVVTEQPLDTEGVATGDPYVWAGTLKRVALPERTADSTTAAQIELEMTVTGQIG